MIKTKTNLFLAILATFVFFTNITHAFDAEREVVWRGIKISEQLKFSTPSGVLVTAVSDSSPATGKLTPQSMFLEVNRHKVNNISDFLQAVKGIPDSKMVMVRVYDGRNYGYLVIPGYQGDDTTKESIDVPRVQELTKQPQESMEEKQQNTDFVVNVKPELEGIIPVLLKFIKDKFPDRYEAQWVKWEITNNTNGIAKISTKTEIPNWCPPIIKQVSIKPGETLKFGVTPFDLRLFQNFETTPAFLSLEAKINDRTIFQDTLDIKIHSVETMMWSSPNSNKPQDFAGLIAYWVTPNDPLVERVLSYAKERCPNRSFSGYQTDERGIQIQDTKSQIKAIFYALGKNFRISYISSTLTFAPGHTQRVRLPKTSIKEGSANCIDGAVLMAALFENIGLEPSIVLVPGHAFVGVRETPGSEIFYCIETTLLGKSLNDNTFLNDLFSKQSVFEKALQSAWNTLDHYRQLDEATAIDIKIAREEGFLPMQ